MSVFPEKQERGSFSNIFLPFAILAAENCDTQPHGLRLANFSIECFLLTILFLRSFVFLLNPPVQLPWSCFFTLSFAIVPSSYFYLSPITVRTELSRHDKNSNREHPPGEKLGLTWWLFLSLDKFYIPAYRYLFISFIPWPSDRKNGSFRCGY